MPVPSLTEPDRGSPGWVAKLTLYSAVYQPFTTSWFAALESSPVKAELLAGAGARGVTATIELINELFQSLAVDALRSAEEASADDLVSVVKELRPAEEASADDLISVVRELRGHVLWVGSEGPGEDPDVAAVRRSLIAKLRRNISLGVLEGLLCLESAFHYAHDVLGYRGEELAATLSRSRQLYGSLAVLHDADERERVRSLTGRTEPVEYPAVGFGDVVDGTVRIQADKFMISRVPGPKRLRFVKPEVRHVTQSTPTMQCPAHRPAPGGGTYNDSLWHLLIDIYRNAGRFGNRPG